jgi:hypothetical protein
MNYSVDVARGESVETHYAECIALLNKGRSSAETTRFTEIRMFWISDYIQKGAVEVIYVVTEDMTSDYFTKPLQGAIFSLMSKKVMGKRELIIYFFDLQWSYFSIFY